jgi:predicted TIM-barrel fold metal-dependent hydrolase
MSDGSLWTGPIVDAHQHFWDPITNFHPWLSGEADIEFRYGDYHAIKRRYMPDDYLRDTTGYKICETVYIETEWDPSDPIGETRYATDLSKRYGVPNAIVAQAWLHRADAAELLARQATFELVRSVRHKPGGPARPNEAGRSLMCNEAWRRGFSLLSHHGLHFDLQVPWWLLDEAFHLARDFPRTTIILNHTGLPSDRSEDGLRAWHAAMSRLANAPNVLVKISGLGQQGVAWSASANRWIILETIAIFGVERCMFASNFPVDSLCASFDTIYSGFNRTVALLTLSQQERLFCGNARAIYKTPTTLTAKTSTI